MTVVAEETTTLPDGATVSVCYCQTTRASGGLSQFNLVRAWRGDKMVEMRSKDLVAPYNLRYYLDLLTREIKRLRALLTEKPTLTPLRKPESMAEFVSHMAANDMFIFGVLTEEADNESKGKRKRKRKVKSHADRNTGVPEAGSGTSE